MGPKEFQLSDSVLMRLIQIFQEACFTGTDCSDLMREIRLQECDTSAGTLVFTDRYVELVKKSHADLLARAATMTGESSGSTDVD